jgi:hypothetical protein
MLNAYGPVHYKAFAFILSPHLLSTTSAHPRYKQCCSERVSYFGVCWRCCWVLGIRNPQSSACDVWSLPKRKSLIISLFHTWYYFCIHLYGTICMKLDPGMHIGLHLVFFGKTGVTIVPRIRYLGFTLKGRRVPWLLLVFVKPTEILWWIIHKSTDTGEHSIRERVLNIESTERMVKRVSKVYD